MNKLELDQLSPEQKRERIANICHPQFPTFWEDGALRHRYDHYTPPQSGPAFDYLHDLNAMESAADKLTEKEKDRFLENLTLVLTRAEQNWDYVEGRAARWFDFMLINATAAHRADAFLLSVDRGENNPVDRP